MSLWDERKKLLEAKTDVAKPEKAALLTSVFFVKTARSAEAPMGPTRGRCRSKREKDKTRQDTRDERKRLFREAFHDNIDSRGEVDALTGSDMLSVDRGDVLRDPKLKYIHPSLVMAD